MAREARDIRISRRSWLLAGLAIPAFRLRAAEALSASFDGDDIHPIAPTLHFLSGKSLQRLKNGNTVVFLSQLTLFSDERRLVPVHKEPDRLIVSYDIWEENRFSVSIPPPARRSIHAVPAEVAEAWCLENLSISASGIPPDRPFWLRFELRSADPKDFAGVMSQSGISIPRMIDWLSRKPGADEDHWMLDSGRLRLNDLVRITGRPRNG